MRGFFRSYWRALAIVLGITAAVVAGIYFHIDAKILALFAVVAGFVTNGFAALVTLVSLVPVVGPLIIKVFSIPLLWIFNGLGYFVSALAIRKGYGSDVVSHRVLTVFLLIGVVIGYVLGNLLPFR